MMILGIDPGTTAIGYALLSTEKGGVLHAQGLIPIASKESPGRLQELFLELGKINQRWSPDIVSVERLFFSKNVKTAFAVAEARGVILLTTALANQKVYEYTPLEVKKIVTGDGGADKTQLKKVVQLTLKETKNLKARDDVFDAIGLALACSIQERRSNFR